MVIASAQSLNSEWVKKEVERASARQQETGKVIMLPIRIDSEIFATSVPWAKDLRSLRTIGDFSEWRNQERYRVELAKLLIQMRSGVLQRGPDRRANAD